VKTILLIVAVLMATVPVVAQEGSTPPGYQELSEIAPAYQEFDQALGFSYGPVSATGLHYHVWKDDLGIQGTGGFIYVPLNTDTFWSSSTTLDYNLGGEVQKRVYGEAFASWLTGALYLFAGGNHRGFIPVRLVSEGYTDDQETTTTDDDVWVEPVYGTGPFQAQLTVGIGIGIEIVLFRHFSFPFEFGYGGTWTVTEPDLRDAFLVDLNVQTGVRYRY
jgi:hypothetical protein